MHVGLVTKKLSQEEIDSSIIKINPSDMAMFPKSGILFFIESYEEYYGCHITNSGIITGLEEWFSSNPITFGDVIILSKYSEGYYLVTTSEIVESQKDFSFELERILTLEPTDILCPNCRYNLEHAGEGSKEGFFLLKCARCGFTLVKKSHFD